MLLVAVICMFVATAILAGCACFCRKNKTLLFLFQTLALASLVCLAIVGANYHNNFAGYSIFIIIAIIPQFLSLFNLKEYLKIKKESLPQTEDNLSETKEIKEEVTDEEVINEEETVPQQKDKKRQSKHLFLNSDGTLLQNSAFLLTSICLAFSALYIGMETFYGFLIGLALACALTLLLLILKKIKNPFDTLSLFIMFLGIGILFGQMLTALLYATNITNILFCIGCLVLSGYACLENFLKSRFDHLALFLAFFCLVATMII